MDYFNIIYSNLIVCIYLMNKYTIHRDYFHKPFLTIKSTIKSSKEYQIKIRNKF